MIIGKETNTVYLSEVLSSDIRFKNNSNSLISILNKHSINYKFLKGTADIWCRDYMPIQLEKDTFIQFRYEPSYLKEDLNLQSNPKEVCKANGFKPKFTNINLDGGNIVNWSDRAIVTDRVFDENPQYSNKTKLVSDIENLLQIELIIIPQIKPDLTGHADGLVRFLDQNTLLGNNRNHEYSYWKNGINKILKEHGITYIDIPFLKHKETKYKDHAIGCYINYLEVKDLIIIPIFEVNKNKDLEVIEIFKQVFTDRKIETINFNEIGFFGGLLNCTTWTIKE